MDRFIGPVCGDRGTFSRPRIVLTRREQSDTIFGCCGPKSYLSVQSFCPAFMPSRRATDEPTCGRSRKKRKVAVETGASNGQSGEEVKQGDAHSESSSSSSTIQLASHTGLWEAPVLRFQITPAFRYSTKYTQRELENMIPESYWLEDSQHDTLCRCEYCMLVFDHDF